MTHFAARKIRRWENSLRGKFVAWKFQRVENSPCGIFAAGKIYRTENSLREFLPYLTTLTLRGKTRFAAVFDVRVWRLT